MEGSLRHLFSSFASNVEKKGFTLGEEGEEKGETAPEEAVNVEEIRKEAKGGEAERKTTKNVDQSRERKRGRTGDEKPPTEYQNLDSRGKQADVGKEEAIPDRRRSRTYSHRRGEIVIDVDATARKFIREKSEAEIEKNWLSSKKDLWSDFKANRRDHLRGRKHGVTNPSTRV